MTRDELVMLIAGNNSYEETNTIMQAIDSYVASEVERVTDEFYKVAINGVEHVAMANYPEREREALNSIRSCYSKLRERAKGE